MKYFLVFLALGISQNLLAGDEPKWKFEIHLASLYVENFGTFEAKQTGPNGEMQIVHNQNKCVTDGHGHPTICDKAFPRIYDVKAKKLPLASKDILKLNDQFSLEFGRMGQWNSQVFVLTKDEFGKDLRIRLRPQVTPLMGDYNVETGIEEETF